VHTSGVIEIGPVNLDRLQRYSMVSPDFRRDMNLSSSGPVIGTTVEADQALSVGCALDYRTYKRIAAGGRTGGGKMHPFATAAKISCQRTGLQSAYGWRRPHLGAGRRQDRT
jgi:hypothetical protein